MKLASLKPHLLTFAICASAVCAHSALVDTDGNAVTNETALGDIDMAASTYGDLKTGIAPDYSTVSNAAVSALAAIPSKASTNDVVLTALSGFSEWQFGELTYSDPGGDFWWWTVEYPTYSSGTWTTEITNGPDFITMTATGGEDATSLNFTGSGEGITASGTLSRTRLTGYKLGSQSTKPLQPAGDYATSSDFNALSLALAEIGPVASNAYSTASNALPKSDVVTAENAAIGKAADSLDTKNRTTLTPLNGFSAWVFPGFPEIDGYTEHDLVPVEYSQGIGLEYWVRDKNWETGEWGDWYLLSSSDNYAPLNATSFTWLMPMGGEEPNEYTGSRTDLSGYQLGSDTNHILAAQKDMDLKQDNLPYATNAVPWAVIANKPTIPAAQVNSDWNATSGVAQILNKPDLTEFATKSDATLTSQETPSGSGYSLPADCFPITFADVDDEEQTFTVTSSDSVAFRHYEDEESNQIVCVAQNHQFAEFWAPVGSNVFTYAYSGLDVQNLKFNGQYPDNMSPRPQLVVDGGTTPSGYILGTQTNKPIASVEMVTNNTAAISSLSSQLSQASQAATNYTDSATNSLATVARTGSYNDLSDKPTIPTVPTTVSSFANDAGYATSNAVSEAAVAATNYADSAASAAVSTANSYTDSSTNAVVQHVDAMDTSYHRFETITNVNQSVQYVATDANTTELHILMPATGMTKDWLVYIYPATNLNIVLPGPADYWCSSYDVTNAIPAGVPTALYFSQITEGVFSLGRKKLDCPITISSPLTAKLRAAQAASRRNTFNARRATLTASAAKTAAKSPAKPTSTAVKPATNSTSTATKK